MAGARTASARQESQAREAQKGFEANASRQKHRGRSSPPTDYPPRINASEFCVQWSRRRRDAAGAAHMTGRFSLARISEMTAEAALCPFSIQLVKKLMQKIHRLTDN
jgi:hypothetical protein